MCVHLCHPLHHLHDWVLHAHFWTDHLQILREKLAPNLAPRKSKYLNAFHWPISRSRGAACWWCASSPSAATVSRSLSIYYYIYSLSTLRAHHVLTIYTISIQYLHTIYTLSVQVLVAVLTKVLFVVLVLVNIWCSVGNLELAPQNDGNIWITINLPQRHLLDCR